MILCVPDANTATNVTLVMNRYTELALDFQRVWWGVSFSVVQAIIGCFHTILSWALVYTSHSSCHAALFPQQYDCKIGT